MGLLGGGVFRHGVTVDDGIRRDRAGIRGEFIPALLRAGHIQIGGNGQHFLRQRFVEHAVEAGQIGFDQIEVCGDARELIQRPGYVDVREHVLDFAFRKALVHQGLNLRQEGKVFREGGLVHLLGEIFHFGEDRGLIGFGGETVFAQQRKQVAHIVLGLLNAFLIPYRRDHIGKRFRVFQGGGAPVGIVAGVEFVQRDLPFPGILDQLNHGVFLVILRGQFRVDRGHTFRRGDDGILIDGNVRVALSHGLGAGDGGLHLFFNGGKAIRIGGRQIVLDLDGVTGIDQLLQPDLFIIREEPVLPFLQEALDLRVHGIQLPDAFGQIIRHGSISGLIGGSLEGFQFRPSRGREFLPGIRPLRDYLVRFLLAIRPHGNEAVHPALRVRGRAGKGALVHAEGGQSVRAAIECVGGGILPFLGGLGHALEGLAGFLCAGNIISNGNGRSDNSHAQGHPYGGRAGQRLHESAPAAACCGDSPGEFRQAAGDCADACRDLAEYQQHRPDSGDDGGNPDNQLALAGIQGHEALEQFLRAVDQLLNRGRQILANLLRGQNGGVFEILEPGFRGGISLVRFIRESHIFLPGIGRGFLGGGKQFRRIGRAQQRIAQAHLGESHFLQGGDGGNALFVHLGEADDERLDGRRGIGFPQLFEGVLGHAGYLGEIGQRLAARFHGDLHFNHGLGKSGAARLGLQANGGKGGGKAEDLRLGQSDLRAC